MKKLSLTLLLLVVCLLSYAQLEIVVDTNIQIVKTPLNSTSTDTIKVNGDDVIQIIAYGQGTFSPDIFSHGISNGLSNSCVYNLLKVGGGYLIAHEIDKILIIDNRNDAWHFEVLNFIDEGFVLRSTKVNSGTLVTAMFYVLYSRDN